MAAKKPTSFALSARSRLLIKLIAEKEKRSQANAIEVMAEEKAERIGVKLPKDWKPPADE